MVAAWPDPSSLCEGCGLRDKACLWRRTWQQQTRGQLLVLWGTHYFCSVYNLKFECAYWFSQEPTKVRKKPHRYIFPTAVRFTCDQTLFPDHWQLVSCPPRTCLPARKGPVNEVEFLGLIPQMVEDQWDRETANYYVHFPYKSKICSSLFKYPHFFLSGFSSKYFERC